MYLIFSVHAIINKSYMLIHLPVLLGYSFAYIDPNAGGWLFQLLFPVFVTIGGVWMVLRKKAGSLRQRWIDRKSGKSKEHQ